MSLESVENQSQGENHRRKNIIVERSYKGQGSRGWTAVDNKAGVYNKLLSSDGFRVLTCILSIPESQKLTQDLVIDLTGLTKYIVSKSFMELKYFGYLEIDKRKVSGKFNTDYKVTEIPKISQLKKYNHPKKDKKKAEVVTPERKNQGENFGAVDQDLNINTTNKIIYKTREEVIVNDNKIAQFENYHKPEITPPLVKINLEKKITEKEKEIIRPVNNDPLREKKIEVAKRIFLNINGMEKQRAWEFIKNRNESEIQEVINQLDWRSEYCNSKEDPSTMFITAVIKNYPKPVQKNTSPEPVATPSQSDDRYTKLFDYCLTSMNLGGLVRIIDKKDEFTRYVLNAFYNFYIAKNTDFGKGEFDIKLRDISKIIDIKDLQEILLESIKNSPHRKKTFANIETVDNFMRVIKAVNNG